MEISEKFENELHEMELSIVEVYRDNSDLSDIQIERAVAAAIAKQNAILKGKEASVKTLSNVEFQVFENLQQVIQDLVEREAEFSIQDLLQCLKLIRKSVKRWNKKCGRQGYISFISQYV